jgi:hypothetical protein
MMQLEVTWRRVVVMWVLCLLRAAVGAVIVLAGFGLGFLALHLLVGWLSSSPEIVENRIGIIFGPIFGAIFYLLVLFCTIVALRVTLRRRIGDFRVVLMPVYDCEPSAAPNGALTAPVENSRCSKGPPSVS